MTAPVPPRANVRQLAILRVALLAGVLAFGAVIWFLQSQPGWRPSVAPNDRTLRYLLMGAWAIGVGGVLACFLALQSPRRARDWPWLPVVGWACAEAIAIAGAVHYFQTGAREWYIWGIGAMLITWFIFPLRRPT